jgi:hypothetical protein
MIRITFPLHLGSDALQVTVEGETQQEVIEKVAKWQELQVHPPEGATELRFSYRESKNKSGVTCSYYSIFSPQTGMEFLLGQRANGKGEVFPKKWVKIPPEYLRNRQTEAEMDEGDGYDEAPLPSPPLPRQQTQQPPRDAGISPELTDIEWSDRPSRPSPPPAPPLPLPTVAQRQQKAEIYLRDKLVRREGKYYKVGKGPDGTFTIWRNEAGHVRCNTGGQNNDDRDCPELAALQKVDPEDRCVHIMAVKLFLAANSQAA